MSFLVYVCCSFLLLFVCTNCFHNLVRLVWCLIHSRPGSTLLSAACEFTSKFSTGALHPQSKIYWTLFPSWFNRGYLCFQVEPTTKLFVTFIYLFNMMRTSPSFHSLSFWYLNQPHTLNSWDQLLRIFT